MAQLKRIPVLDTHRLTSPALFKHTTHFRVSALAKRLGTFLSFLYRIFNGLMNFFKNRDHLFLKWTMLK